MRIQFSVSKSEEKKLKKLSSGYPDIASYCKDAALQDRTYGKLWQEIVRKIENMESGYGPFALRDLISSPPANMGVKLYQNQKKLNIEFIKKDNLNTDTYKKI